MGAGKTTVAALLASAWGTTARDTDADVEARDGREISDIFVESGEAFFRELEAAAVAAALAEHDGVLALGGGAVLDPATRALLAGHRVVFLRVGLSEAVKRVGLGTSRPLLLGNVRSRIKALLDERTADLRVGRHRDGRHRRAHARGGRRRDRPPAGWRAMNGRPCSTSAARRRTTWWSAATCSTGLPGDPGRRPRAGGARARRATGRAGAPASAPPWRPTTCCCCRSPTARTPRRPRWRRGAGSRSARPGSPVPTRWSRSAAGRPPTSAASWPRRGCAASGSCTCRPACWRWSTPRSAARPASTPAPARTSSAPSTSLPACCATWRCSTRCRARSWSPASARWSSAASSPTRRSSTSSRPPTRPS